jgi:hypothetical protein
MFDVITIGEALVEIMRPDRGQPLDGPGEFRGPFTSGAPALLPSPNKGLWKGHRRHTRLTY